MIKRITLFSLAFAVHTLFITNSSAMQQHQLTTVAKDYLGLLRDTFSPSSIQPNDSRIASLFAENLTKIDNRTILFENNRDLLLPQMLGFEKEHDPVSKTSDWSIDIDKALIIPSQETNTVVIYFEWAHTLVGRATTMAILQCNSNGQIERIIDVWAKIKTNN